MAKKDNGIVIGDGIVERLVALAERSVERMEGKEEEKKAIYQKHEGFIDSELKRIEDLMKDKDPASHEYYELTGAYDRLLNITRYW